MDLDVFVFDLVVAQLSAVLLRIFCLVAFSLLYRCEPLVPERRLGLLNLRRPRRQLVAESTKTATRLRKLTLVLGIRLDRNMFCLSDLESGLTSAGLMPEVDSRSEPTMESSVCSWLELAAFVATVNPLFLTGDLGKLLST